VYFARRSKFVEPFERLKSHTTTISKLLFSFNNSEIDNLKTQYQKESFDGT